MRTIFIRDCTNSSVQGATIFDLQETKINNCIGCWSCWWKTPGVCIYKDLEAFYRGYVNADSAVFCVKLNEGFVSSKMKSLLDRMIPLFLPYTSFRDGGTFHTPRYPKYPNVEFYYDYDFKDEESYKIFYDYVYKVFVQFHSPEIKILHVSELEKEEIL